MVGIQDMGAAGLTSSSFEMASRAGGGITLDLDKVPMRETGMTPYEIMLSESQERMLLVAEEGAERRLKEICKWDLDCIQIGTVTDDGCVRLNWHGEEWGILPARALADEAPKYDRPYEQPANLPRLSAEAHQQFLQEETATICRALLRSTSLASRRWVTSQFDHTIGAGARIGPGQADAALVDVPLLW